MRTVAFAPEWVALCAGVKPALRLWRPRAAVAAAAAAATRRGFATVVADRDDATAILYVARDAGGGPGPARRRGDGAARTAGRLDARLRPRSPHLALGQALGYPRCCVEAYLARLARGVDRLPSGRRAHEDHVAAATAAAASARLDPRCNVFDAEHTHGWLSHYPCRFDCGPSIAYADRVAAALTALAPAAAAALATALATPVAIEPDGRRRPPPSATAQACVLAFADRP
jgi:hypothetical protein